MQGNKMAEPASMRRTSVVRINPSPARRLLMPVAKISTPGTMRSNGVANVSPAPKAVTPRTTTWTLDFVARLVLPRRSLAALISLKLPLGP